MIDRAVKMTSGVAFGSQILSEIVTTAAAMVFQVHRALLSTEDSGPAADLLDVLHRFLRLFGLCKVSGDIAKEVSIRPLSNNYNNNILIALNGKHTSADDDVRIPNTVGFTNSSSFHIQS